MTSILQCRDVLLMNMDRDKLLIPGDGDCCTPCCPEQFDCLYGNCRDLTIQEDLLVQVSGVQVRSVPGGFGCDNLNGTYSLTFANNPSGPFGGCGRKYVGIRCPEGYEGMIPPVPVPTPSPIPPGSYLSQINWEGEPFQPAGTRWMPGSFQSTLIPILRLYTWIDWSDPDSPVYLGIRYAFFMFLETNPTFGLGLRNYCWRLNVSGGAELDCVTEPGGWTLPYYRIEDDHCAWNILEGDCIFSGSLATVTAPA